MSIPEAVLRNRCYHIHLGSSYTFLMCDLLRLGGHGGLLRPSCTAGLPARHILFGAGDLFVQRLVPALRRHMQVNSPEIPCPSLEEIRGFHREVPVLPCTSEETCTICLEQLSPGLRAPGGPGAPGLIGREY